MTISSLERGSGLIEFSLLIMLLMSLALGVFDFGLAIEQGIMAAAAAHAGAEYGATEGNANDTAGMQSAALNAAVGLPGFAATATTWCSCSAGGATVSCATICNTYDLPLQYVRVQSSVSVPLLLPFTGLPASVSFSNSSTLRAK